MLNVLERLSERVFIAVVQVYVVPRCGIGGKANRPTHRKGNRLGFRFSNTLGAIRAARRKVEP
jgi:hypothetical protein